MAELIYTEPIKVICVKTKSSKKLIKGAIYSATGIGTEADDPKKRNILISIGRYSLDCFTSIDGKSLEDAPDFKINWKPTLDKNKNFTNQCVRCRYGSGKSIKTGEIYFVEDQRTKIHTGWNGTLSPYIQVKIRGLKRWLNADNFEEMPIAEQRKIKLNFLNGDKIKTGEQTRKFLLYSEKEKIQILLQLLVNSLVDFNIAEHTEQVHISELILNKGKQYNIINEDITEFLENVKPILIPYNFC